jgi:hypothetical protein
MRDLVEPENFYAALRFDLDGTPLRYVPSRPKPSGETKKFSSCAKCSSGRQVTERIAGYAEQGARASITSFFLLPRPAAERQDATFYAFLVVSAGFSGGDRIRRRIVPLAERKRGLCCE